jgi:hypothetical protein
MGGTAQANRIARRRVCRVIVRPPASASPRCDRRADVRTRSDQRKRCRRVPIHYARSDTPADLRRTMSRTDPMKIGAFHVRINAPEACLQCRSRTSGAIQAFQTSGGGPPSPVSRRPCIPSSRMTRLRSGWGIGAPVRNGPTVLCIRQCSRGTRDEDSPAAHRTQGAGWAGGCPSGTESCAATQGRMAG